MLKPAALCLFLLMASLASAQQYSIYQNISTSNGLPSNYVFAVCEDENGFLWAGTDKGLCRFDGFRWQVWDRDNGLPGNYVNTVISDNNGGLWLRISEKGYYHFDSKKGAAQPLDVPGTTPLTSVAITKEGNFFAEILQGSAGLTAGYLFHSASPGHGELIYKLTKPTPAILHPDPAKKRIICFYSNALDFKNVALSIQSKWPLISVAVPPDVYEDKKIFYYTDSLLISNTCFIRPGKKGETRHNHSLFKPGFLQNIKFASDSVIITNTDFIKFNKDGQILYKHSLFKPGNNYAYHCATSKGYYVNDVKTGYYFISHSGEKTFYNKSNGLGTDYVNQIYQTKDGTIILTTLGAGLQLIKNDYRKTYPTGNKLVRTVLPLSKSWYILAGDKIFKTSDDNNQLLDMGSAGHSTLHVFKTGDTLLAGSLNGISFFKERPSVLQLIKFLEFNSGISSIIKIERGYIAGTFGNGIIDFTTRIIDSAKNNHPMRIVEKLIQLPQGYAALSYEDGLILTGRRNDKIIHLTQKEGLLSNSVYSVHVYNDSLWIGTKGGLNIYANGKILKKITFAESSQNNKVLYCFHDAQKKLWVVSNKYLYHVNDNVLKPVISHPLVSDDDVITTAAYNNISNELAVGSNKAFSIISLDAIRLNALIAAPKLLQIVLDGKLQKGSSFEVPYQFNALQFTVAPLSASPFSRSRFYYMLKGRDNTWMELKDSLTISFSALRPGSYQFITKTINADGYESKLIQIASFSVQKPFWQQWPFIVLCIAATATATTWLVKMLEKQKQKRQETKMLLQQTLQNERERISKDLHDHLGANLATIIAQTDNIEARLYRGDIDKVSATVQLLSSHSRETMNVLRETIWAVQEKEHPLSDFIIRITTFLQRLFESTNIKWEVKNSIEKNIILSPAQTLHLFRILQESSQNIMKHSGATHVQYYFSNIDNQLQMLIRDNGCGFNSEKATATNGITNLKVRVEILNGSIEFKKAEGTTINISIPV